VAGDKLGKQADVVNLLSKAFKNWTTRGNVITPFKEFSVPEFIEAIRDGTLVHLTCLGERDRTDTYYLRLGPELIHRFKSRHVKQIDFSFQPLVFTNACSTVSGFMTLKGYSNLAWEIYQRGAGAYIGTIAPVPSAHAISFAETVYDELINKKRSISDALWQAKRIFSAKEPLHPFYLLYCLYGNSEWRWPGNAAAVEAQQANR
jgi:CHAT domain-containing protein